MRNRKKPKDLIYFGLACRRLREARNLSQEELAEKAEVHRTYISGIERATRNCSVLVVWKIARALGVKPGEFFED